MKQKLLTWVFVLGILPVLAQPALAIPTQYGDSGLLSQPSADTLNAGNICLGLWTNCSSGPQSQSSTIVPVAITLGLGTFLEAYGSYPNLLFNNEELQSGRGFANLGMKARIVGKRSSDFKIAVDGQARRSISDLAAYDGLTDFVGRAVASYKRDTFGIHANVGYSWNEAPAGLDYQDQVLYGGGIEFYPMARLRLIAEAEAATERISGQAAPREVSAGFQYFFSPHLTLNLGGGMGLSDTSPDWRILAGLSACQGIGTYQRPIPKIVEPETAKAKAPKKPEKVVKIKTLTPLIPKQEPEVKAPVSRLEVPLPEKKEEVILYPKENLPAPEKAQGGPVATVPPVGAAAGDWPLQARGEGVTQPITGVVYRHFRLPEFAFGLDQWDLSEEGKKALAEVAESLRQDDRWFIMRIEGHTDDVGSAAYNEKLSLKRALACASYLVTYNGVDPARIFVKGLGEADPIAPNTTAEGRAKNRRVEILVLVPKEGAK